MACKKPLEAYQLPNKNEKGKSIITFTYSRGAERINLPCGQCVLCRLERSRQWALRIMHESDLYNFNSFITLTYDEENLPLDGSLRKSHFQKFMKRLRERVSRNPEKYLTDPTKPLRFYMCGEYGDINGRPHYHAIIFNLDFNDKELIHDNGQDNQLFSSDSLSTIWTHGLCSVGNVTFESAAYVARYIMKKVTGDLADDHYSRVDPYTGEYFKILPEYTDMSRRPGIGKDWYDQFKGDLKKDFITHKGVKMKPPKYYDRLYEEEDPEQFLLTKQKRKEAQNKIDPVDNFQRLAAKAFSTQKKLNQKVNKL
jgi:hypothetical protein